jgi:hypothetical protein
MPNEPTLEELSAYLDAELDAATQARVAQHVAGCQECAARLEGLRQAAYAIRALPMETPRRTFTIPAQRRESFRWAPVGWLGGAAAALLIVVVGVNQMHGPVPSITAGTSKGAGAQYAAAPHAEVAPLSRSEDSTTGAQRALSTYGKTVVDPQNSSRSLTISTDAASYPSSGVMIVYFSTRGLSAAEASSVKLLLSKEDGQAGDAIRLLPPSDRPFDWQAAYSIPQMHLQAPIAGSYSLQVTIEKSDHQNLTTWLPVTITP